MDRHSLCYTVGRTGGQFWQFQCAQRQERNPLLQTASCGALVQRAGIKRGVVRRRIEALGVWRALHLVLDALQSRTALEMSIVDVAAEVVVVRRHRLRDEKRDSEEKAGRRGCWGGRPITTRGPRLV